MALTNSMVEKLIGWCYESETIANIRAQAREQFFGCDNPEEINYIADTGSPNGLERRFLGWFAFNFKLPDGQHPAELAARELLKPPRLDSVLDAIRKARYVTGIVTRVTYDRGFSLEMEDEKFTITSPELSRIVKKGQVISAHILPTGKKQWLIGPGWLVWPVLPGPNMRSQLKSVQPDPIAIERLLQKEPKAAGESEPVDYPQDDTFEAAVARMSEAAKREGKSKLILSPEKWKNIILSHMMKNDAIGFAEKVSKLAGDVNSVEEINKWLALAMNIWNTTPQPDRGGKSAIEIMRQQQNNKKF